MIMTYLLKWLAFFNLWVWIIRELVAGPTRWPEKTNIICLWYHTSMIQKYPRYTGLFFSIPPYMYLYGLSVILHLAILPNPTTVYAEQPAQSEPSESIRCPENLSGLHNEMESLLRRVDVPEFIRTMRGSLTASIPEAIRQTDGLQEHIMALEEEIQFQDRVEKSAEFIARDVSNNPFGPLEPCRRREKSGYCSTVERYYMARAANLANRGFLDALRCYQDAGVR